MKLSEDKNKNTPGLVEIFRQNVAFQKSASFEVWNESRSKQKLHTSFFSLHSEFADYIYQLLLFCFLPQSALHSYSEHV